MFLLLAAFGNVILALILTIPFRILDTLCVGVYHCF